MDSSPDLYALLIGIDKYEKKRLYGAVYDTNQFEQFLGDRLKTPSENIKCLHDEKATRSAIIQELSALKDNERIVKDRTAVIIYYAGHGGKAKTPSEWTNWNTADGHLELMCPIDVGTTTTDGTKVEAIPDRTITHLLWELSIAKGNNITLIFDCCHSAGLDRDDDDPKFRGTIVREYSGVLLTISPECDSEVVSRVSGLNKGKGDWNDGFCIASWDSHVLLAACSRDQTAREKWGEGFFTTALLDAMNAASLGDLTYKSLMHRVKMKMLPEKQTPHLDGKFLDRIVFTRNEDVRARSMVLCDYLLCDGTDGKPVLSLRAGSIQGVTAHSTYGIYDTDLPGTAPLVTAIVSKDVKASSSHLQPKDWTFLPQKNPSDKILYARLLVSSHELLVYCHGALDWDALNNTKSTYPLSRVCSQEEADVCLKVDGDKVSLWRGGTNSYFEEGGSSFDRMEKNGLFQSIKNFDPYFPRIKPPVSAIAQVRRLLDAYAHFTHHTTIKSSQHVEKLGVTVEMHKLKRDGNNFSPDDPSNNLLSTLKTSGVVEITVDWSIVDPTQSNSVPRYGFTIHNTSEKNLYPHILHFDTSTFEIDIQYTNMTSNKRKMWEPSRPGQDHVDTCLEKHSQVTFGHGYNMIRPFVFSMSSPEQKGQLLQDFRHHRTSRPSVHFMALGRGRRGTEGACGPWTRFPSRVGVNDHTCGIGGTNSESI
ncbi:caspase domain-containing protein [Desarmillaria ectypa]|nr:caspase domain-containing protein [Desarmillaria ectypa]